MSDKPDVYWVDDSGGVSTCHKNDGSLNHKQSLIATLNYRASRWHVVLANGTELDPNGFESLFGARRTLEKHVGSSAEGLEREAVEKKDRTTPRTAQKGEEYNLLKKSK